MHRIRADAHRNSASVYVNNLAQALETVADLQARSILNNDERRLAKVYTSGHRQYDRRELRLKPDVGCELLPKASSDLLPRFK
ncbi:MAG: hypothetical protein E5V34_09505, partial [Mesorhizobium sp.]